MSEYKLVPFEPTPEMVEAAEEAHMPFGDMDLALRMAILAAHDVQGEPTASPTSGMNLGQRIQHVGGWETERGTVEFGSVMAVEALVSHVLRDIAVQGEPVGWQFYQDDQWWNGDDRIKDHRKNTEEAGFRVRDVYAAPQTAEHQPYPERVREGAPYDDPAFESLCREYEIWGTAAAAQCAVFWGAGKRVAEQKPAPDVAGLVDALEAALGSFYDWCEGQDPSDIADAMDTFPWVTQARTALSAHRKQGGEA